LEGGQDGLVGYCHPLIEPCVDLIQGPVVAADVLNHLKVGDGHSAGIGQEVGNDMHLVLEEDGVSFRCGGAVGQLNDDLGLDLAGVILGYDVL